MINNAIAEANVSYDSSAIPIQLELAHKVEVDYTEEAAEEDVFHIACPTEPDGSVDMAVDLIRLHGLSSRPSRRLRGRCCGFATRSIFKPQ